MNSLLFITVLLVGLLYGNVYSFTLRSGGVKLAASHSSTARNLFGRPEPPKNVPEKKNDGGMFGGMGNMMESLKKAQDMAKQAEIMNKELESTFIIGKDTSGAVTATFNGMAKPISVDIEESVLALGADAVSLAATQAVLEAHAKSQAAMMGRMQELYAGLGLPMPPGK
jgi:DNA-binding protein YbaB